MSDISDRFSSIVSEDSPVGGVYDLDWNTVSERRAIMSYILPSRTYALGATGGLLESSEVFDEVNLAEDYGYTNSDFHHSAQFLDSYVERRAYWEGLNRTFGFGEENDGED